MVKFLLQSQGMHNPKYFFEKKMFDKSMKGINLVDTLCDIRKY